MPRARLTELSVARAKPPKSGRRELWDQTLPGFGLRITEQGAKSWVVFTRVNGHMRRFTLGKPPVMSLGEARREARAILHDAQGGRDPVHERRRRDADAVALVVKEFIERDQKAKGRRSWREVERVLTRELSAARWMDRPITSINKRDVIALLDQVMDRGSPIMANRALAHVRRMLAWCVERGILEVSPAAGVKPPGEEVSRDRVLGDTELAAIWAASDGLGWPFGPIVKMLVLTAQRRDEVAGMAWDQLDVDQALWMLPRGATKADRAHDVPLSEAALAIITGLPRHSGPLVFSRGERPPSGFSRAKVRLDSASGVAGWRLHDLRRSVATGLAKMGHPPHVVSALLNHSPAATQGVTAIYQRHRYLDERRAALDVWARHVGRLIGAESGDVVRLQIRSS